MFLMCVSWQARLVNTGEVMLNGKRERWYYKQYVYPDFAQRYLTHKVVPCTWHCSSVTSSDSATASAIALIPTVILVVTGVLFTVFVSWLIGLIFFLTAPVPLVLVAIRYINAYPHKGNSEERKEIDATEDAFAKMHPNKQKE